ncbi:MAG: extracellular solute-binding protein [Syntrophobacteraceae bacterium]
MIGKSSSFRMAALMVLMGSILGTAPVFAQEPQRQLLIYCGITMVRPTTEIARLFEKGENVKVIVSQGGSEELYQALKKSGQGDLYFSGESAFREAHLEEGILGDVVTPGYNQAALVVAKGNPKHVKPDLNELLRQDLNVVIGSPESGSIGFQTRKVLQSVGIYEKVVEKAGFLAGDSRSLNAALKNGEADLLMNWRATAYFPENVEFMTVLDLDPAIVKREPIQLNYLKSSKYSAQAHRFMELAMSPEGQAIFRKFGFIDSQGASAP